MDFVDLPSFNGKITVIGDVMIDRYWYGSSSRISPEAPVPVVNVQDSEERAGGAANVALNIRSLGAECDLIGIVGDDQDGKVLGEMMASNGIAPNFIFSQQSPTIAKLRVISRHQQLIRVDFEKSYKDVDYSAIQEKLKHSLKDTKVVVCSDYGKGTLGAIARIIQDARLANVPVLIDPKGTDFTKYAGATLLTPNMSEFEAVVGKVEDNADLEQKALNLIKELDLSALLITRSEDGMSLIRPDMPALHIPTAAREVYDVTGAGDTVIATLAAALASGSTLENSCRIANFAAGVVVAKVGTSTATPYEIAEEIDRQRGTKQAGILSREEVIAEVKRLKNAKKRIVMTNGCFDILHRGHVDYLQKARAYGDVLIVAVNSDESVQRLKGPTRPIVTLENRMEVLSALGCVDIVVPFSEDTPQALIADILPDILVKGGDYTVEQIAGHKEVIANGGKVMILNFVDNCSTTSIVKKIQEQDNK